MTEKLSRRQKRRMGIGMREVPHLSEMVTRYDEPEIYTPILNPCREGCAPEGCGANCECQCHHVIESQE
jgi:hypothetical protein